MLIITILSLLMAASLGWLALRLLREEQRRSEARVVALSAALDDPWTTHPATRRVDALTPRLVTLDADGADDFFKPAETVAPRRAVERPPMPRVAYVEEPLIAQEPVATLPTTPTPRLVTPAAAETAGADHLRPMFGDTPDAQPARDDRRWLVVAAVAVMAVLGVFALRAAWSPAAGQPASAVTTAAPAGASGVPVELVSLGHARESGTLVIRGLVRNPVSASPRAGTSASVFLFAGDGSFLGSGRAVLDTPKLGAGDEAAFEVTLPDNPDVRRYRVTFRGPDGDVVPHLDRRGSGLAANNSGSGLASR